MNISYNWLNGLIDIDLSPDDLARRLTNIGLAVEGIHPHGDDSVLDIDLTSNRPDCLSHLGVAREISAFSDSKFQISNLKSSENLKSKTGSHEIVRIEDANLCHRFTARIIRNVKIGPSPRWLVARLESIGERSINNVADITNYVMHELGQPMHSFDADKLAENRIVVRSARLGETITTLDEVERKLDGTMLAICDADKPVAVAGIMGGLESSITHTTVNVLLEVAYFKRESVRATSRKLGLATEASYRFERGVDIENLVRASDRATELICELAGGGAGEFVDLYPTKFRANEVESTDISAAVKRLTGLEVNCDECTRVLAALGIVQRNQSESSDLKSQIFLSPSWRHDVAIEEDLVEEIARHIGYDSIATELPPAFGAGEYRANELSEKLLRQTLVDIGFDEALSYSFIDTRLDGIFETAPGVLDKMASKKYVTLQNSVIEGAVRMRPSMLPGLLDAVRLNFNHQRRDLKLFEIGKVFAANTGEDNLPNEQEALALVLTGAEAHEGRAISVNDLDFYDAKGALEAALAAVGVDQIEFGAVDVKHLRTGQSAAVIVGGETVGYLGRLNDETSVAYKFRQPVYLAEINLQTVLHATARTVTYRTIAKFPGIVRDVSFLAKRDVEFAAIRTAILKQSFELCRSVLFVDVYEGKGLADDERSITVRMEYRSDERTLIEQEVENLHQQIISGVEARLGVRPRV